MAFVTVQALDIFDNIHPVIPGNVLNVIVDNNLSGGSRVDYA